MEREVISYIPLIWNTSTVPLQADSAQSEVPINQIKNGCYDKTISEEIFSNSCLLLSSRLDGKR